jgi:uncharacterized protein
MKLQSGLILAVLFFACPVLAQTPAGGSPHQPGVPAAPAPAAADAKPAPPANEKVDPAKEAAIRHLLDITEGASMGQGVSNGITQHVYDVMRHTISPDRVPKFMETFTQKFNAAAPPSAITDAGIAIYAQNFSMEDIRGLIQFYESPLGKRVVKTMPEVDREWQSVGQQMDQKAALAILWGMSDEYTELKRLLPPDPSKPAAGPAPAPGTPAAPSTAPAPARAPAPPAAPAPDSAPAPKPAPAPPQQ